MQTLIRFFKEFWFPALVASAWTAYNARSTTTAWTFRDFVNVLGPSFFIASWASGQFFRIQKQAGVDRNLTNLDARIETLTKLSITQSATLDHVLELVIPERRAEPTGNNDSEEIVPLSRVVDFYDSIATLYNKRNTGKYLATYVEIDRAIRSSRSSINGISVCDLGGGTGTLLRWFTKENVLWTNIDISRECLKVFDADFNAYPRKVTRIKDVRKDVFIEQEDQFDVVVMSYLWSSLDRLPDFNQIRGAMKKGSMLLVADNHFTYVQKNPRYGYENIRGKTLSIRPRPMRPDEVREQVQAAGFIETSYKLVSVDGVENYSQVHVFKKSDD